MFPTVTQLLDGLAMGTVSIEEVAANFAERSWPEPLKASDTQLWGVDDDDAPDADSWSAVNADSRLTPDQYQILAEAYRRARRGESGATPTSVDERGLVVAAVQPHTGAMVALVPAEEDASLLAVDGGEDADQLHVTLAYLGDAADIPAETRQRVVDAMRRVAASLPAGEADGFAVSVFNPGDTTDRDTCIVLGVSGDGLEDVHGRIEEALLNLQADGGLTLPDQHAPWIPHITLAYTDDLSMVEQLTDRVGPVTFDRLRVAFAGENIDIPLDVAEEVAPDGDELDIDWDSYLAQAIDAFVRSDAKLRAYWIRGEGALKIRWNTPGDFTRCVRNLRRYVRDPEGLCAEYHKEATGRWPGEKHGHADEGEDTMANDAAPMPAVAPDGEARDCPPGEHRMPDGECMPDSEMPPDAAALPGEHFHTVVTEGVSTGMRMFAPDSLTWREPPFAYHWQVKSSAHSGTPETVQVGLVTRAMREGSTVHFWGAIDLRSPEGLDYARRLAEGFARWSSIGLDESLKEADVEYVWPAGTPEDVPEPDGLEVLFSEPEEMVFHKARIAEVTAVSVPALADATVEPTPELIGILTEMGVIADAEPQPAEIPEVEAEGLAVAFGAVGPHDTGTSDESWDADANVGRLPSPMSMGMARGVFAWVDDGRAEVGKVPKDAAKFPHHNVSADGTPGAANLTACSAGIGALHGARAEPAIPDGDRRGVYNHLRAHLLAGGREPDTIPEFADTTPITAAGYTVTIPDLPPEAWFDEPTDMSPHGELRVNEAGRIWGFLAPRGVAHRSFRQRVEVPMGRVDYGGWMNKPWPVSEGHKIYTGVITMECGHASTTPGDHSYHNRREHYDNSCSVAAHARIGENRHGVWIAGALAPWIDAEQLGKLMSCQLSGDWDSHKDRPGWRDFVAALLVPTPGFPNRVPAASVRVAEGVLVASAVPVRFVHTGHDDRTLRPALERIAKGIGRDARTRLDELHARVHRDQ